MQPVEKVSVFCNYILKKYAIILYTLRSNKHVNSFNLNLLLLIQLFNFTYLMIIILIAEYMIMIILGSQLNILIIFNEILAIDLRE